jgi:hypothetical protein
MESYLLGDKIDINRLLPYQYYMISNENIDSKKRPGWSRYTTFGCFVKTEKIQNSTINDIYYATTFTKILYYYNYDENMQCDKINTEIVDNKFSYYEANIITKEKQQVYKQILTEIALTHSKIRPLLDNIYEFLIDY